MGVCGFLDEGRACLLDGHHGEGGAALGESHVGEMMLVLSCPCVQPVWWSVALWAMRLVERP